MGRTRDPQLMAETKTLISPFDATEKDPETGEEREVPEADRGQFTISKATNRMDVQRQNMFSKVRYFSEDDGVFSERDFPMGDLQIATIALCLKSWNLQDKLSHGVPINEQTIQDWMTADERQWLYEEIIEFNPIWQVGGRAQARKN